MFRRLFVSFGVISAVFLCLSSRVAKADVTTIPVTLTTLAGLLESGQLVTDCEKIGADAFQLFVLKTGCHRYCENANYTAGFAVECNPIEQFTECVCVN